MTKIFHKRDELIYNHLPQKLNSCSSAANINTLCFAHQKIINLFIQYIDIIEERFLSSDLFFSGV